MVPQLAFLMIRKSAEVKRYDMIAVGLAGSRGSSAKLTFHTVLHLRWEKVAERSWWKNQNLAAAWRLVRKLRFKHVLPQRTELHLESTI